MRAQSDYIDIEGPFAQKPRSSFVQHLLAVAAACAIGALMAISTSPGML